MRLELGGLAVDKDCLRPRLKRPILQPEWIGCDAARQPHALFSRRVVEQDVSLRVARRCLRGSGVTAAALASALLARAAATSLGHADLDARGLLLRGLL